MIRNYRQSYERALERMHEEVKRISCLESVIRSSITGLDRNEIRSWLGYCKKVMQKITHYQRDLKNNPQLQDLYESFRNLKYIVQSEKEILQGYI